MEMIAAEAAGIASEVRRRRQQRGWTLDDAAARLGISRRLLVQIEGGSANPSLTTLLSIAAGFDTTLADLLGATDHPQLVVQTDTADAPVLWTSAAGGLARMLVASGPLELWEWTLGPGDDRRAAAHRPGSRETLLVTAGVVSLQVGTADPISLSKGQAAGFRADEPHSYRNPNGRRPAAFLLAVHEPIGSTS